MPILSPSSDTALEIVRDVIDASWDQANGKVADYEAKMTAVQAGILDILSTPTVTAGAAPVPTINEPLVDIPFSVTVDGAFDKFTAEYIELANWLAAQGVTFITDNYPDEHTAYTAAEDWLQAALANPSSGLPPSVAAQILGDAQTVVLSDKGRASDAVIATFAARRYPLPPGAAASAILQIEQKAQDEIAETARKIAIMSVELQKSTVDTLMKLRATAMGNKIDYIKALASGPDMVSRMINVGYDAQSKNISSVASYYNARSQATEVISKVNQFNTSLQLEAGKSNQNAEMGIIGEKVKTYLDEARALAQMATALFNNLHAQAGVSGQRGTHVQYQYKNDTQDAPPAVTDVF